MKLRLLHILVPISCLALALISYLSYNRAIQQNSVARIAERIQVDYQNLEREIVAVISDTTIVSNLITDSYTFDEFSRLASRPYGIVVYAEDSALIWTNNFISPVRAVMPFNDAPLLISETNGEYVIYQHDYPGEFHVIGFLPLQFDYGISNRYLDNVRSAGLHIPNGMSVQPRDTEGAIPVFSNAGHPVFYIAQNDETEAGINFPISLYIYIIACGILLLIILFHCCRWLITKFGRPAASGVFAASLVLLYILVRSLVYDGPFRNVPLFDPQYYGSPGIAGSTGDLLIKTLWLFAFALFFSRYFFVSPDVFKVKWRTLIYVVAAVVILGLSMLMGYVFRSLIMDSAISFDIYNFFSLNYFSIAGFLCIALLVLSYFFIVVRLIELISRSQPGKYQFVFYVIGVGLLWLLMQRITAHPMQTDMALVAVIFTTLRIWLMNMRVNTRSLAGMMVWLIFFSALSAFILYTGNFKKEEETKRLFAVKKSIEKDPITEYLFRDAQIEIHKQIARNLESNTGSLRQGFVGQIRQDLQTNYFKKYTTDIFVFSGDSLKVSTDVDNTPTLPGFVDAIENNGEFTAAKDLYFINDYTGNYYYLAELVFQVDSLPQPYTVYLRMIPRKFSAESIYPELLIDDDLRTAQSFTKFDYAIYNDHSLSERNGAYSYPLMDIFYLDKEDESADIRANGYDHYIYKVNDNKKVIVSTAEHTWLQPVSLFSYLFFFFLVFLVLMFMFDWLAGLVMGKIVLSDWIDTTLQNKIQSAVISLIVFAFMMMGVATVFYISNQYNNSHKQRLLEKIEGVQTNIDYLLGEGKKKGQTPSALQLKKIGNRVAELSEVHAMDINIYKPNGVLMASSQPDIFDKGLVSRNMQPLAFFKMSCDKETWYIQTESIGELNFLSAYVPVLDMEDEVMFYLNLPYFATEQNLRSEISSFMVTLVNVYVLLLILAGIIAFFVSRSITRPLATIAGKFREIKLGKSNEPINWTHDDEIGILVDEYNKMLKELERSAQLLARSERESAWRDMAKQVAHEIKNPLTPMRLSIQHLQRAIQTNAPNTQELTKKVTETILEQIDNLTHIASEFSNFAVMPKAVNENLCLNDILISVTDLFSETEDADITLQITDTRVHIFADKSQIIRVLTNVLKNAIQAIPDDRQGSIEVVLEQRGNRALVKVTDNGKGISDDERDKVFVPNFTTKSSGMGIGLAMTKNIVEGVGGYIWFESTPDIGTTFFIEFPIKEDI